MMTTPTAVNELVVLDVDYTEPYAILRAISQIEGLINQDGNSLRVLCTIEKNIIPLAGYGHARPEVEEIPFDSFDRNFTTAGIIGVIGDCLANPLTMLNYLIQQEVYNRQEKHYSLSTLFKVTCNYYRITMNLYNGHSELWIGPCGLDYLWDKVDNFLAVVPQFAIKSS